MHTYSQPVIGSVGDTCIMQGSKRRHSIASACTTYFASYDGKKSVWKVLPPFLAKQILAGMRPPMSMTCDSSPLSANWEQNCFLKFHKWLHVGRVLYMYWLKTFSVTIDVSISL